MIRVRLGYKGLRSMTNLSSPVNGEAGASAIVVRNLVKRYAKSKTNAVDGVSFEVARGEIFGLLGPNGAGKTTTIGVLTTAIVPTGGSASIMNTDVARDPIAVKQRIAVVPQQSNLDRSLRVREILTFHGAYHSVPRKTSRDAGGSGYWMSSGWATGNMKRLTATPVEWRSG